MQLDQYLSYRMWVTYHHHLTPKGHNDCRTMWLSGMKSLQRTSSIRNAIRCNRLRTQNLSESQQLSNIAKYLLQLLWPFLNKRKYVDARNRRALFDSNMPQIA